MKAGIGKSESENLRCRSCTDCQSNCYILLCMFDLVEIAAVQCEREENELAGLHY